MVYTNSELGHQGSESARAESLQQRWGPETQFVGALMWITATQAEPLLDLILDSDIDDPLNRWAIAIIRSLVAQGHDPNPAIVIRVATNPDTDPQPSPRPVPRYHQFTLHIADAYEHSLPGASAAILSYAREVLDDSFRRAFRVNGGRMIALADAMTDREDLTDFAIHLLRVELASIWRRTEQLNRLIRNNGHQNTTA